MNALSRPHKPDPSKPEEFRVGFWPAFLMGASTAWVISAFFLIRWAISGGCE